MILFELPESSSLLINILIMMGFSEAQILEKPHQPGHDTESFLFSVCCAKLLQSCPTVCDPTDCSPPGSSVHGILQAGILEWLAMPSSRGSSWPRNLSFLGLLHWQAVSLPLDPAGKFSVVLCLTQNSYVANRPDLICYMLTANMKKTHIYDVPCFNNWRCNV